MIDDIHENKLYNHLYTQISKELKKYFGINDNKWVHNVTKAWINDVSNSEWRYREMYKQFGENNAKSAKILDVSSGCGTFVFYGLLNGIDVYGIEPEGWKNTFNLMKIKERNYPRSWESRFICAVGEDLPFKDNQFDIISTYQTLEHVQDIERTLSEMIRCLKVGGSIFLKAPDYLSTFEGHYRLPWLPLFPRGMAKLYLKVLGKPIIGLDTIKYITSKSVKRILKRSPLVVSDKGEKGFRQMVMRIIKGTFRSENNIDLYVFKDG